MGEFLIGHQARFHDSHPTLWNGRYARIPGETSVFHLDYLHGRLWPFVLWDSDDGRPSRQVAIPGGTVVREYDRVSMPLK